MGSSYRKNQIADNISLLLDSTNLKEIKLAKEITEKRLKFWWAHYSDLANQRHAIYDELQHSLIKNCSNFEFDKWQRAVKYKYALHPLSTIGSYQYIGGRYNYGNSINNEINPISALYIASDKDTALQEHLGQGTIPTNSGLTSRDLALTSPESEAIVSVSGKIEQIIDLTDEEKLIEFVRLISAFKISSYLTQLAREAHLGNIPLVIKTVNKLLESLLDPNWRVMPSNYDIPANSQIFGHICYTAGIEGILYPSKLTKKPCLAIFPTNFNNSDSYVQLDGDLPHKNIIAKIDHSNYDKCETLIGNLF